MHWLQTLDTNLFLFFNRSLVNPFFDWLMPVLSGNHGVKKAFPGVAMAVGAALLCFGGRRARLCVVMTALIVGTNDGLVCNTIKHAVARARPLRRAWPLKLRGGISGGSGVRAGSPRCHRWCQI